MEQEYVLLGLWEVMESIVVMEIISVAGAIRAGVCSVWCCVFSRLLRIEQ